MKSKKKVGLVKRIAAGVCAVMVFVGCMGTVPYYAGELTGDTNGDGKFSSADCVPSFENDSYLMAFPEYVSYFSEDFVLPSDYDNWILLYDTDESKYYYIYKDDSLPFVVDFRYQFFSNSDYPNNSSHMFYCVYDFSQYLCFSSVDGLNWVNCDSRGFYFSCRYYEILDLYEDYSGSRFRYVCSSQPLNSISGTQGILFIPYKSSESYNSSLGYLQNISLKELYLKGGDVAYDPETCKKIWSFGNASTSDLDISDGSYTIRHYQQITVRESSPTPVVKEYEKILMGEYPVSNGSFSYMAKDSLSRLETESGFEPLGFWDTSILKRYTSIVNYFQLVRTNEDGSVEYGGLVKVDLRGAPGQNDFSSYEYGATTYTYEGEVDTNGYVDRDVPIVQAIAYDYEDAEDKADEELGENSDGSSSSGGDLIDQIDDIVSSVMAIPEIFARMFSFLPDWCLNFFGISVALAGAVILWKAFT